MWLTPRNLVCQNEASVPASAMAVTCKASLPAGGCGHAASWPVAMHTPRAMSDRDSRRQSRSEQTQGTGVSGTELEHHALIRPFAAPEALFLSREYGEYPRVTLSLDPTGESPRRPVSSTARGIRSRDALPLLRLRAGL